MAKEWSPVRDLAYLFLALAHGADGDLAAAEKDSIVEKLTRWDPALAKKDAIDVLNEIARVYLADRKARNRKRLDGALARLEERLDTRELRAALSDLVEIAQADGVILDSEWDFLDRVKESWGVLGK